jgi:hypothetical protein
MSGCEEKVTTLLAERTFASNLDLVSDSALVIFKDIDMVDHSINNGLTNPTQTALECHEHCLR